MAAYVASQLETVLSFQFLVARLHICTKLLAACVYEQELAAAADRADGQPLLLLVASCCCDASSVVSLLCAELDIELSDTQILRPALVRVTTAAGGMAFVACADAWMRELARDVAQSEDDVRGELKRYSGPLGVPPRFLALLLLLRSELRFVSTLSSSSSLLLIVSIVIIINR